MPTVGAPVQGYYYDQNTDTLRPIAGLGAQGPQGPAGPQGPPSGPAGQAENVSLTGTNVTVPAVGWQKVPLNTQNVGFNWDNTNKRWVCPTTGAYNISGICSFTMASAQNSRIIISIWVNGVERSRGTDYTAGTTTSAGAGGIAYCDTWLFAGDYVELYSYSNPVKALDWVGGSSNSNMLTIRMVTGTGLKGDPGVAGPQGPPGNFEIYGWGATGPSTAILAGAWTIIPVPTSFTSTRSDSITDDFTRLADGTVKILRAGFYDITETTFSVPNVGNQYCENIIAGTTGAVPGGGDKMAADNKPGAPTYATYHTVTINRYFAAGSVIGILQFCSVASNWVVANFSINRVGAGATGLQGATGSQGPTGPSTPFNIFSLKGAGDNAIPAPGSITVNSTSITSITQINISYYPYPGVSPMPPVARTLRAGSVMYMMDQASPGNYAMYQVTALISDNASPNWYVAYSVSYIAATGGFIIDRQILFGLGGTELKEQALGVMGTIRGTGTLALSSTPQVAMTLAPIQLKTQRQYAYNVYVRAVSATAQNNGNITSDVPSGVVLSVNYNIVILPGGTGFYYPIMYRQFFYCSAAGNYTLNCKLSIASGSGTAYLDQGGYLSIEDLGPLR
jgi:hypothetical protein